MKKIILAISALLVSIFILTSCDVVSDIVGKITGGETDPDACEHADLDGDYVCDECGEELSAVEENPCSHRDSNDDNRCDLCESAFSDGKDITHEHTFGEWEGFRLDDESTCEEIEFFRSCSGCNAVEWEKGSYEHHSFTSTYLDPTCASPGLDKKVCNFCGLVEESVIPQLPHTFSEWIAEGELTNCVGACFYRSCDICDAEERMTGTYRTHSFVFHSATAPCIPEPTITKACTTCGFKEAVRVDPIAHTPDENGICRECKISVNSTPSIVYTFSGDGKYAIAASYEGDANSIVISEVYAGLPVTSIAEAFCYDNKTITEITIPDSVTQIASWAFTNCDKVKSITLGNGVTEIGYNAFSGCIALTDLVIGDNLKTFEESCFVNSRSLKNIYVTSIETWCNISGKHKIWKEGYQRERNLYLIEGGEATLLTEIVIPDGVTAIYLGKFTMCTSITKIVIPESVTYIGAYAFYGCPELTIYCEAESKPEGWDSRWNSSNYPVVWGYAGDGEVEDAPQPGNRVGKLCYDYELSYVNGDGKVKISDLRGKVVVINFWGTWCTPCVAELPHFDDVASEYSDKVVVVTIHSQAGLADAPGYIAQYYPDSEILFTHDEVNPDNPNTDDYYVKLGGRGYYPMTLILDDEGVITFKYTGSLTADELETAISTALGE